MTEGSLSPAGIMQLGMAFWGSKTFLSAVELGVFTELAGGALDGETLRRRLGLHQRGARDIFDALVALRMLEKRDGKYANTAETDFYLDRAKPSYVGGILEMANQRLYGHWGNLTEALRTGQPQNEAKGSVDYFAALYSDRARLESFLKAMTGASLPTARAIAAAFPWKDYQTFCDVGCAQGGLTAEVASAHGQLRGTGFDLAPVQPAFEAYIKSRGLADRVTFKAGSFFEDELPRADVLVMGHILHDWDLAQKKMLLAKALRALPVGGALIVYDAMIDDGRRENAFGLLMSLNMLIETPGGFDYTGGDCLGWMREAGFRDARVQQLQGPYSMAVATK
jgi:SAM-dependent methyltransferase